MALGVFVGGFLYEHLSPQLPFYLAMGSIIPAFLLTLGLVARLKFRLTLSDRLYHRFASISRTNSLGNVSLVCLARAGTMVILLAETTGATTMVLILILALVKI